MKRQRMFVCEWKSVKQPPIADPTRPKLRASQKRACEKLKDAVYAILSAPTGFGKSLVIAWLILYKLARFPKMRCIIAVPQTLIGAGFVKNDWKIRIGRKLIDFIIGENLCHSQASNCINRLIRFLEGYHTSDRILLCTHATLAHAFKKLKTKKKLHLLSNTLIWIDEAHHIMNAQVKTGGTISNAIGALVKYCLEHGNHIGLATATYTRHDRCHIIPETMAKKFVHEYVPYDEYMREVGPVKTFEFNIICGSLREALDKLFKKMRRTILYLAKRNSSFAGPCKYTEVKSILKQISKRFGKPIKRTDTLITIGDFKILDLVTEKNRHKRKEYLDNGGKVDMIIALETCKEGFDWPEAERSIIIGERHSIPEMIQMIGRLFRVSKGKNHAEVFQIMPGIVHNKKQFEDSCNRKMTVIFSAMILEDIFLPVTIKGMKKLRKKKRQNNLAELLPDTKMAQELLRDFIVAVNECKNFEQSWRMAKPILSKYEIPQDQWKLLWKKLWLRMSIVTKRIKGLKMDIDFKLFKGSEIVDGLLKLTSGLCGITTFSELRKAIGREKRTVEEWVIIAETMVANNPSHILPSQTWLNSHGYHALTRMMWVYPKSFAHIQQDNQRGKSPAEWLLVAKNLVIEKGELPCMNWLYSNGYSGLTRAIRENPKLFSKIKREYRGGRSPLEWVPMAEKLEKEFGTLPCGAWLVKNGFSGLPRMIKSNPSIFAHIKREQPLKTPAEWVTIAERLQKELGHLPNYGWLKNHGYDALNTAISNHPEQFAHISRSKRLWKTPEEWVPVAKKLTKGNGNCLPSKRWLMKNGYGGLVGAKNRRPELFIHLPQHKCKRPIK